MSETADFDFVPIVEVTVDNITLMEPVIRAAIANSNLVSIDCELSGLGDRKKLNAASIEDRYNFTGIAAKTRSIISLGLSTFRRISEDADDGRATKFQVQTFDIMVLCSEDYIVEPASLKFLVEHGFDFIKQYSKGLTYYRGNDKAGSPSPLRQIFSELIVSKKPIVLHNGLIDLVFLYQNLYAQLPVSLEVFLADLADMFPAIYDTKFLADYVCRMPSSFLEFVFKMLQKRNLSRSEKSQLHIRMSFQNYPENFLHLDRRRCKTDRDEDGELDSIEVCNSYADHGHCDKGQNCDKSHNIDRIVRQKVDGKRRKVEPSSELATTKLKLERQNGNSESSAGHRAGFDAFMTGFSFLVFLTSKSEGANGDLKVPSSLLGGQLVHPDLNEDEIRNKIYLVCKDFPLLIKKSNFAKNSICHAEKIAKLRQDF